MLQSNPRVLVVDPEPQIRKMLAATLAAHAYQAVVADGVGEALRLAGLYQPDAVLLESALDNDGGLALIDSLREWTRTPILVLSERDDPEHIVTCLQRGANDFVAKPFNMQVLLARLEVALRDHVVQEEGDSTLTCGDIEVDLLRHEARKKDVLLELSPREYELLSYLIRNKGNMLTHRQLLKALWGEAHAHDRQYLRVYIKQLRHKIETEPHQPEYIITETGVGYRMDEPGSRSSRSLEVA